MENKRVRDSVTGRYVSSNKICSVENCEEPVRSNDFCKRHYEQFRRTGNPIGRPMRKRGEGSIHRGYKILPRNGVRKHPFYEHRAIIESILNRPLYSNESVHHKNGNKLDNRPENLELWVISQPYGQRVEDLIFWAKEILERYEIKDEK